MQGDKCELIAILLSVHIQNRASIPIISVVCGHGEVTVSITCRSCRFVSNLLRILLKYSTEMSSHGLCWGCQAKYQELNLDMHHLEKVQTYKQETVLH